MKAPHKARTTVHHIVCEPARYLDADQRRKSLYLKAASYE
jgi:hypothetical protein